MSLRSKIALVLFLAVSLFAGGDFLLTQRTYDARILEFDSQRARSHAERVRSAFEAQLSALDGAAREVRGQLGDSANWAGDTDQIASFFADVEFDFFVAGQPLDAILVFDDDGWILSHSIVDPTTSQQLVLRDLPNQKLSPNHPFICRSNLQSRDCMEWTDEHGVLTTERGALLIGLRELENSNPPLRIAVGRFVDEAMLDAIEETSGGEFELILTGGSYLSEQHQEILALSASANGPLVREEEGHVAAWTTISDLRENVALLLHSEAPTDLTQMWSAMSRDALFSALAVATLFPFVILLILQWVVTGPLSRLTSHVVELGGSGETDVRLDMQRTDEIGQLADEFDDMLSKLAQSRLEVVANARLAGMSELSSGVMHTVGNVLNSVSVSASLARARAQEIQSRDLQAIVTGLEEHAYDLRAYLEEDERGKHLLPFLGSLLRQYCAKAEGVVGELDSLEEGVQEMATLVSSLVDYDSRTTVVEKLDVSAQVDAAVELCVHSTEPSFVVEVIQDYENLPRVRADRHKLMEILTNMVLNAMQAMEASAPEERKLTLRVFQAWADEIQVDITDNGHGIPNESLALIFAQGYTTRPEGRGLGLHLAGITALEINAQLTASSAGVGKGATFSLRLPLNADTPMAAPPSDSSLAESLPAS